jgi:hypothetical protein
MPVGRCAGVNVVILTPVAGAWPDAAAGAAAPSSAGGSKTAATASAPVVCAHLPRAKALSVPDIGV